MAISAHSAAGSALPSERPMVPRPRHRRRFSRRAPAGGCLTAARFPVWRGKVGVGFHEVNARRSDFAFVSAAAQVELGDDGNCKRIAIGVGAAVDFPTVSYTHL